MASLRYQSSGVGGRCTPKVHFSPSVLHLSDHSGRDRTVLIAPQVSRRHRSRATGLRLSGKYLAPLAAFPLSFSSASGLRWLGSPTVARWSGRGLHRSAGWLPASPSAELQAQLKPVALDLAIMKRSVEQLAGNQDQLARKQDQMAQAFATLQAAVRDINQNILSLAPLAPKAGHASPKPAQPPAQ